jgi:hypothetical protein
MEFKRRKALEAEIGMDNLRQMKKKADGWAACEK